MNRKCAIYNRYNTEENLGIIVQKRKQLINYCENTLKIKDYAIFEDDGTGLKNRKSFQKMLEEMKQGKFTDLLVYHPNKIYRAEYNREKFNSIVNEITSCNVKLHSIKQPKMQIEEFEEM